MPRPCLEHASPGRVQGGICNGACQHWPRATVKLMQQCWAKRRPTTNGQHIATWGHFGGTCHGRAFWAVVPCRAAFGPPWAQAKTIENGLPGNSQEGEEAAAGPWWGVENCTGAWGVGWGCGGPGFFKNTRVALLKPNTPRAGGGPGQIKGVAQCHVGPGQCPVVCLCCWCCSGMHALLPPAGVPAGCLPGTMPLLWGHFACCRAGRVPAWAWRCAPRGALRCPLLALWCTTWFGGPPTPQNGAQAGFWGRRRLCWGTPLLHGQSACGALPPPPPPPKKKAWPSPGAVPGTPPKATAWANAPTPERPRPQPHKTTPPCTKALMQSLVPPVATLKIELACPLQSWGLLCWLLAMATGTTTPPTVINSLAHVRHIRIQGNRFFYFYARFCLGVHRPEATRQPAWRAGGHGACARARAVASPHPFGALGWLAAALPVCQKKNANAKFFLARSHRFWQVGIPQTTKSTSDGHMCSMRKLGEMARCPMTMRRRVFMWGTVCSTKVV